MKKSVRNDKSSKMASKYQKRFIRKAINYIDTTWYSLLREINENTKPGSLKNNIKFVDFYKKQAIAGFLSLEAQFSFDYRDSPNGPSCSLFGELSHNESLDNNLSTSQNDNQCSKDELDREEDLMKGCTETFENIESNILNELLNDEFVGDDPSIMDSYESENYVESESHNSYEFDSNVEEKQAVHFPFHFETIEVPEQQSNPLTISEEQKTVSGDVIKIFNIPYSNIQEFKSIEDFINKGYRPSIKLPSKYRYAKVKTLLICEQTESNEPVLSADSFYNCEPLFTFDKTCMVGDTQHSFGEFALNFFSTIAVKMLDENQESLPFLSYKSHKVKEQAGYLLIRRFYNLTGFLFEFRNPRGTTRPSFELCCKLDPDDFLGSKRTVAITVSLDKNIGCFTITDASKKTLSALQYYQPSCNFAASVMFKDCSNKHVLDALEETAIGMNTSEMSVFVRNQLLNFMPENIVDEISMEKLRQRFRNRYNYEKNKNLF